MTANPLLPNMGRTPADNAVHRRFPGEKLSNSSWTPAARCANANLPTVLAGGQSPGPKHGQHLDCNLPKIKKYDLANYGGHYHSYHSPGDGNARLTNLLLTIMNEMEVNTEQFVDSLGPISDLMG